MAENSYALRWLDQRFAHDRKDRGLSLYLPGLGRDHSPRLNRS
jgi:hypothetical protein